MRTRHVIIVIACGLVPWSAWPTTLIIANEQQLAQQADAVVVGEVEEVAPQYDAASQLVSTTVRLRVAETLKGQAASVLELTELGGETPEVTARFFGVPVYRPGEKVLVFASRRADGAWGTTSLALGKYTILQGAGGSLALRDLGPGSTAIEWDGRSLRPAQTQAVYDWQALRSSVRATLTGRAVPKAAPLSGDIDAALDTYGAPFALMSTAARWFQADRGEPVTYLVDPAGDAALGAEQTNVAIDAAMEAWTSPAIATLFLQRGGDMAPGKLDCSPATQIMFNDPNNLLSDPWFCSGILAVGGYCAEKSDTTEVNGVTFQRITSAKILFNNGWDQCPFWNTCNLAEVVTHELGHTIGLGHSGDHHATMFAFAHFDGRCAGIRADDLAGLSFIYPASSSLHDAVVVPPPGAKVRIRRGKSEVYVPLTVTLRHGDTWGDKARFRLVAQDGTCPTGTVGGANFGQFTNTPDQVELAPAAQAKATVWLSVRSAEFITADGGDPARCELVFTAEPVATDNIDPVPGNESVRVPLDVVDENDFVSRDQDARLVLEQIKPVTLRLPRGKTELRKLVTVKIRTGPAPDNVSVHVNPGTCPGGLVQPALIPKLSRTFAGVAMGSNARVSAQIPLVFQLDTVTSIFPGSPARCTAEVRVTGQNPDGNPTNNAQPLVIDLRDDNDL
ncbi:MAG: matrixin family metalloprotease [Candidatus Binatia bacterium]|nr:matrixin family metalloprotease [Candidatus Binatia bacterium]